MGESLPAIRLESFGGGNGGGEPGRLQCLEERLGDGVIDLHAADIEAVDAAAVDDGLAGADGAASARL